MGNGLSDRELLDAVLEIYDQKRVAEALRTCSPSAWPRESVNRWVKNKADRSLSHLEYRKLQAMLPKPVKGPRKFTFIDLFAGIGGLRKSFEDVGGQCLLTSEWNKFAVRTYKANYHNDQDHRFNSDIRDLTQSEDMSLTEGEVFRHVDASVPDHDVLLAGFPCQPFSIAGVTKKNALGRAHGFECKTQGTLFFDVARILQVKQPAAFLLENVKNLKTHDGKRTFQVISETLSDLGYWVADLLYAAGKDPKIIDAKNFVPQHRERIVLVGFRKDLQVHDGFSLRDIEQHFPKRVPTLGEILDPNPDSKYVLTQKLWEYLFNYHLTHRAKGNGFGYGLVSDGMIARTLSHRYYKDGSEILVDRGFDPAKPIDHKDNIRNRPRRLTPRECARLMGYDAPGRSDFVIPVSDNQAYQQFGNSVVVPVFQSVAKLMLPRILAARKVQEQARTYKSRKRKRA